MLWYIRIGNAGAAGEWTRSIGRSATGRRGTRVVMVDRGPRGGIRFAATRVPGAAIAAGTSFRWLSYAGGRGASVQLLDGHGAVDACRGWRGSRDGSESGVYSGRCGRARYSSLPISIRRDSVRANAARRRSPAYSSVIGAAADSTSLTWR